VTGKYYDVNNDVFTSTNKKAKTKQQIQMFSLYMKYFYLHYRCGNSIVCFTIIVSIIYVFNLSSYMGWLYGLHHMCVANVCSLLKLLCLGHFKKLKLEILKIKDLKTTNRDYKNQPNKAVDTVQLYQLNVLSIWHTVQLAFNHLSYKSQF